MRNITERYEFTYADMDFVVEMDTDHTITCYCDGEMLEYAVAGTAHRASELFKQFITFYS